MAQDPQELSPYSSTVELYRYTLDGFAIRCFQIVSYKNFHNAISIILTSFHLTTGVPPDSSRCLDQNGAYHEGQTPIDKALESPR